jgi:hypothetical protein
MLVYLPVSINQQPPSARFASTADALKEPTLPERRIGFVQAFILIMCLSAESLLSGSAIARCRRDKAPHWHDPG